MKRFIDLFSGIGGFHVALKQAGKHCVFASEINKPARHAYELNFKMRPHGDITQIKASSIPRTIFYAPASPASLSLLRGVGRALQIRAFIL